MSISFEEKLKMFKEIGISAVQLHDDDAVPNMNELSEQQIIEEARKVKQLLDQYDLEAEFVAPRLWMDDHTHDGGFTSNSQTDRDFALWRAYRSIDIANALGCNKLVLWLAREGTLCAESKDSIVSVNILVEAINKMLAYDPNIRIMIESKPNEPIDRSFCPTMGHVMAISAMTSEPSRVGGLLESAHAILAGLDPANEMAFALAQNKLWGVHLNDQNGMKFDQDKAFGSENLRQCFNQVRILIENDFGKNGEYIGLDVKAMRTQTADDCCRHLINSKRVVEIMEDKVNQYDYNYARKCIEERNYEKLEMYVMEVLMGV
ncbi:sugar phosphate isomerase/epimerase family protein [Paenibacillus sp. CMAA1364]